MCLIIYGHEHSKYSRQLDQLFRIRYKVFVQERKWSLPSHNGFEIDQYDTTDAVYFISYGADGAIEASVRLTPTMQSSLLADYFPHLIETGDEPRSPHIYEATRYIVQPARKSRDALREAKARIFVPVVEWCLEQRLTHFQTVIDARALSSYLEISPQTGVLGLAHPFGGGPGAPGGGECMAIRWPINAQGLEDVRAFADPNRSHRGSERVQAEITMH
ncbi:acyl-homoserine-lactone synthase [Methylovirgula sp. HY1]|uniref:acyl-homoserine-lactone synthase n=1 Tax=Methylovirgula sp. HY1 TaxID=2822761 RepID=UPI001C5A8B38|nr:acyl-homoserine-lactone synthase [Methylovirgula sp. HY1]QXX76102.1 4-coumaroyl-homoserine lactone synthase [Methylovirgula sp. HY1]